MKKQLVIYFLTLIISFVSFGQGTKSDSTVNRVDASGKKQGYWKKIVHDTLMYEGYFKDDKPVSQFKYYYGDKNIKAISQFSCDSKFCRTTMYYPSGKKEAEGFYTKDNPLIIMVSIFLILIKKLTS